MRLSGAIATGACLWAEASARRPLRDGRQVSCGAARSFPAVNGALSRMQVLDGCQRLIGEVER